MALKNYLLARLEEEGEGDDCSFMSSWALPKSMKTNPNLLNHKNSFNERNKLTVFYDFEFVDINGWSAVLIRAKCWDYFRREKYMENTPAGHIKYA